VPAVRRTPEKGQSGSHRPASPPTVNRFKSYSYDCALIRAPSAVHNFAGAGPAFCFLPPTLFLVNRAAFHYEANALERGYIFYRITRHGDHISKVTSL
jgi:hypothetical protein